MATKWHPGHYLLLAGKSGRAAQYLHKVAHANWTGVQCRYSWRMLEPTKGTLDFSAIDADIAACADAGKKLVMQIEWHFDKYMPAWVAATYPSWCAYNGAQYDFDMRVPAAQAHWFNIIEQLGARYDSSPILVNVNFQETAGKVIPGGDPAKLAVFVDMLTLASSVFPTTPVCAYANWLGTQAKADQFYSDITAIPRVGGGGPDTVPFTSVCRPSGRNSPHSYAILPTLDGVAPVNMAVQSPEYCGKETRWAYGGCTFSPKELLDYAVDVLKANFVCWCDWGPSDCVVDYEGNNYTIGNSGNDHIVSAVTRYIENVDNRINTTLPSNCQGSDGGGVPDPIIRSHYGTRQTIPGTVAAHAFDQRTQGGSEITGEGVTYHDATVGNAWNAHARVLTDVPYPDIASVTGASQAWKLRQSRIGEWQEWTTNVPATVSVVPRIEYAAPETPANPAVRVTLDGAVIAEFTLPSTGSWATFETVAAAPMSITAGTGRVLRVEYLAEGFDWTQMTFTLSSEEPEEPEVPEPQTPNPVVSGNLYRKFWSR